MNMEEKRQEQKYFSLENNGMGKGERKRKVKKRTDKGNKGDRRKTIEERDI